MAEAKVFRCEGDLGSFHLESLDSGPPQSLYNYPSTSTAFLYLSPEQSARYQRAPQTMTMDQQISSQAQARRQQWHDMRSAYGANMQRFSSMASSPITGLPLSAQASGFPGYTTTLARGFAPESNARGNQDSSLQPQNFVANNNLLYNSGDVFRDLDSANSLSPSSLGVGTPGAGGSPLPVKSSTDPSMMGNNLPGHSSSGPLPSGTPQYQHTQHSNTMSDMQDQIFGSSYGDYAQSQVQPGEGSHLLNTPVQDLPIRSNMLQYPANFTYSQPHGVPSQVWRAQNNRARLMQQQTRGQTQHQPQYQARSHSNAAAQSSQPDFRSQRRTDFSQSVEEEDMRKVDDKILLEGKKNGLTYKEIAKRMSLKCAESTLRGRYRSLTKPRAARVRRPEWKQIDLQLLERFVQQEFGRIEKIYSSIDITQKLAKVQWKKVANAIEGKGGTYHFGNSTCKRKWLEMHPEAVAEVSDDAED